MKIRRMCLSLFLALMLGACARSAVEAPAEKPAPLESMQMATRSHGGVGVPVDVRYQVTGMVAKDQPVTLQLAFVPRVQGEKLNIEFPESKTVALDSGGGNPMTLQKAQAAEAYRRSLTVIPLKAEGASMYVIVSMDIADGRYFSVFTIPIQTHGASPDPSGTNPDVIR